MLDAALRCICLWLWSVSDSSDFDFNADSVSLFLLFCFGGMLRCLLNSDTLTSNWLLLLQRRIRGRDFRREWVTRNPLHKQWSRHPIQTVVQSEPKSDAENSFHHLYYKTKTERQMIYLYWFDSFWLMSFLVQVETCEQETSLLSKSRCCASIAPTTTTTHQSIAIHSPPPPPTTTTIIRFLRHWNERDFHAASESHPI